MRRVSFFCLCFFLFFFRPLAGVAEETLQFGRFGTVHLYRQAEHPSHVVLFVSGDGGWNLGVVDMAQELAALDALVVGIDIPNYLKQVASAGEYCSYPAGELEELSQYVQRKLRMPAYVTPVLVGYSSGATLVYAALVEAPAGTFCGAISMGFCPNLPLTRPFCRGGGLEWQPGPKGKGFSFLPAKGLRSRWIAFQGSIDQVCSPAEVQTYASHIPNAEVVLLPKVGHGFAVTGNWLPQFREAFNKLAKETESMQRSSAIEINDLPLVEVQSQGREGNELVVMISGDGGWVGIDKDIGGMLAAGGLPVVGLSSLQYFWTPRTAEGAAEDLERILRHYLAVWNKGSAVLIGYSRGADVLPFMASRLPEDLRSRVRLISLLGPGQRTNFEVHLTDLLGGDADSSALPVLPEVLKLKQNKVLCFYGEEETDSLCRSLKDFNGEVIALQGGHHFSGDYQGIAARIMQAVREVHGR